MADHLEAAILAGTAKGAKSDDQAVKNYRASRDAITAALPHLEKHFAQDPNVRRAIIQELTDEYYKQKAQFGDGLNYPEPGDWLLAMIDHKEAENND